MLSGSASVAAVQESGGLNVLEPRLDPDFGLRGFKGF